VVDKITFDLGKRGKTKQSIYFYFVAFIAARGGEENVKPSKSLHFPNKMAFRISTIHLTQGTKGFLCDIENPNRSY
jgi:hypothetical protein